MLGSPGRGNLIELGRPHLKRKHGQNTSVLNRACDVTCLSLSYLCSFSVVVCVGAGGREEGDTRCE